MSKSLGTDKVYLKKELLILGCGGHSKVVTEVAEAIGFKEIFYLDPFYKNKTFLGRKVHNIINKEYCGYFFVAVGDNLIREKIYNEFLDVNNSATPVCLIHPTSNVSSRSLVGEGTVIMPLCVINSNTKIGKGAIVNTSSSIDHDSKIMDFSSIAPGVNIGGNVLIGRRSAVLIGATISHGISIGNDVIIGGSSFVSKTVQDNCVVHGIPARYIKDRKAGDKYL
tara:strand:- start:1056 stop:1727 length:672 start_codon:yes stop_codon:yes gene_type:complete